MGFFIHPVGFNFAKLRNSFCILYLCSVWVQHTKHYFTRVCVEALYSKTQSVIVDSKSAFIDDEFSKNETGGRKKSIMANRQWHSARRSDPRSTIPILKFTERACTALAGWQMITELAMLRYAIFDTGNFSLNPSPGPEQHRNEWSPVCARKAAGKFELLHIRMYCTDRQHKTSMWGISTYSSALLFLHEIHLRDFYLNNIFFQCTA